MYSTRPGLVLGFHGCDEEVARSVVNQQSFLTKSENIYDWLGPGIYFWEHDPFRALEYIQTIKTSRYRNKKDIRSPSVVGAVIDLGYCFDLMNVDNIRFLKEANDILEESLQTSNTPGPKNKRGGSSSDLLLRNRDCAVIKTVHGMRLAAGLKPFDSVRSMFVEGEEVYPQAGFNTRSHIQICICNPNCIKGLFLPRELDKSFDKV